MKNVNNVFLVILLALTGYGVYLIFRPFLIPIVLAFVFSQLFKGWYRKIYSRTGRHPGLASLLICFLIFLILIIPLLLVASLLANEISALVQSAQQQGWLNSLTSNSLLETINSLPLGKEVTALLGSGKVTQTIIQTAKGSLVFLAKQIYQSTTHFFFMLFVMFFVLYYLLKDQDKIIKRLMKLSPLKDQQERLLLKNFTAVSRATIKGSLVVAAIQGVLMSLGFWAVGVSSVVLWGVITAFLSLLPALGSGIVWLPGGIILLLIGNLWQGIFILAFGAIVVSSVDNLLRPKLVGNQASLHPLLVLLATLGGVTLFGIAGVIIGPILVAFLVTLLDIYLLEFKQELNKLNKG